MPYRVLYHPEVKGDLAHINENVKKRIRKAIETRLMTAPERYGEPLRKTLKGYWKLRVGDYRIVFKLTGNDLIIFAILDRKVVYGRIPKRS